jgi:hypothetical protein
VDGRRDARHECSIHLWPQQQFDARLVTRQRQPRVQHGTDGPNDLFQKASGSIGAEQVLVKDAAKSKYATQWSLDGQIVYQQQADATGWDIWVVPLNGASKPIPYLQTPFNEIQGQLSPDGRWMAYTSDESGRLDVYVQSFPAGRGKFLVSGNGGTDPHWRRDGKELFYVAADRRLMAVTVQMAPTFAADIPAPLFATALTDPNPVTYPSQYDVSADGQRFLIKVPVEQANSAPITVMLNWPAVLNNK